MEFKLNKIDTDLRLKVQEQTSKDKIHYSKKINETKDAVEERKRSSKNFSDDKNKRNKQKKYFTVEGIKYGDEVKVEVEKLEELNEYNSKGRTLDMRK